MGPQTNVRVLADRRRQLRRASCCFPDLRSARVRPWTKACARWLDGSRLAGHVSVDTAEIAIVDARYTLSDEDHAPARCPAPHRPMRQSTGEHRRQSQPSCGRTTESSDLAVLLRSQRNERRAGAALVRAAARRERPPAQGPRARRISSDSPSPRSRASRLTSLESHRPGVTTFVHVGLVVEDLDETVRFLALLGFDCGEPGVFSGEWIG